MVRRASFCFLAAACFLSACADDMRKFAPPIGVGGGSTGSGGGFTFTTGSSEGPPPVDAGGLCGNQLHTILADPPNVYFVFDTSGSMGTPVSGGTRLSVVKAEAGKLVKDLRYVIKVGAASFPFNVSATNGCQAGGQIYPVKYDDPAGFNQAVGALVANGGTPTAATLKALKPLLVALPGNTVVVLATDGGPNCNTSAVCDISECQENIEGCGAGDTCCSAGTNCCALGGPAGPLGCIDHMASVQAVADLWAAGIKVYVVGIPGSQPYAKVLSDMALAGGAPQFVAPYYYEVDNLSTIGAVFKSIATANISCDFPLSDPPQDPNYTNVYFDQSIIPSDPTNGWSWSSPGVVTLHGAACAELKSGAVVQVQIVSGCPTQVAK
jgi:hypothetical protein